MAGVLIFAIAAASGCGDGGSDSAASWPVFSVLSLGNYEETTSSVLSGDGEVVAVGAFPFAFDGQLVSGAHLWRAGSALDLELPGGVTMLSQDARVVGGVRYLDLSRDRYGVVVRESELSHRIAGEWWSFPHGFHAQAVSSDGRTFFGYRDSGAGSEVTPAHWRADGRIVNMPAPRSALGSGALPPPFTWTWSPDGSVIVVHNAAIALMDPGTSNALPSPAGVYACSGTDASNAGRVVVGRCGQEYEVNGQTAARSVTAVWTIERVRVLPRIDGVGSMTPSLVSADGTLVVGKWFSGSGTGTFLWTEDTGSARLRDLLTQAGWDPGGLRFERPCCASNDGRVIAGSARDHEGRWHAFRVDVGALLAMPD